MQFYSKLKYFSSPIKFLNLSKKYSLFYFVLSIISGVLQTISVFAIYPLLHKLNLFNMDDVGSSFIYYYNKYYLNFLNLDDNFLNVFIFFIFLTVISSLINLFVKMSSITIAANLTKKLRMQYIQNTLDANWSYFISKKTGEIVNTIINESGKTISGFVDTINFLSSAVQFFVFFIFVFFISDIVGYYSLIVGILYLLFFRIWGKRAKTYGENSTKLLKNISNSLLDGFKNIKTIKIFSFTNIFYNRLDNIISSTKKNDIRLFSTTAYPDTLKEPFFAIFISIGLFFALSYEIIVLSSLVTLLALFQRAMAKFSLSFNQYITIKKMEPFLDSYFVSINFVKNYKIKENKNLDFEFNKTIKFDKIYFSYNQKNILKNINLEIAKGSIISIMGKSGSGKTTIIDLILNLLNPISGNIYVDDLNMKDINMYKWQSIVGCITQDHYFFNDSIYNNLTLGSKKYNKNEINNILKLSLCDDFLNPNDDLNKIYMGESGSKFSGGQKQRLSIARTLLREPEIIILDEATSALDKENEEKILKNLKYNLNYKPTIILITHNQDIIRYSDHSYCIRNNQLYSMNDEIKK